MKRSIVSFAEQWMNEVELPFESASVIRRFSLAALREGFMYGGKAIVPLAYKKSPVNATITCEGLVYGMSGFAEAMRNVVYFLNRNKINVTVDSQDEKMADNVDITTTEKGRVIDSLSKIAYQSKKKKIRITMLPPTGVRRRTPDEYLIAYVMFETQDIPKHFIEHLEKEADEIWCPSTFNVENFTRAGWKKPIFRMPLGVDTERFNPEKVKPLNHIESPIGYFRGKFIFLSIMGWSERKGVSRLLEAYFREFSAEDDTVLYIKGGWYNQNKAWLEVQEVIRKVGKKNVPLFYLDFDIYPDEKLPRLYKSASAFVLPSLGEGWGLNYTEAMSMMLPTIGTKSTSMIDFMNNNNSFLIEVEKNAKEPKCDWITPDYVGMKFAIPSIKSIRENMRKVYQSLYNKEDVARHEMKKYWTWELAAKNWISRLEEIPINEIS